MLRSRDIDYPYLYRYLPGTTRCALFPARPERTRFVLVYYRALLVASSAAAARMYVVATIQILVLCFSAPGTGLPGRQ